MVVLMHSIYKKRAAFDFVFGPAAETTA